MAQWYETLFTNYARKYDAESYTRGTAGECDFLEKEIDFDKKVRILDIGCGTGRHSIELAKRGYAVTGIDLSESQLARAKEKAGEAGLAVDFRRLDARELPFDSGFELAIMMCEGAFPLMETDEMNYRILQGAGRSLVPGGKLVFTALNGLFPLFHSIKEFLNADIAEGNAICDETAFDYMTMRERAVIRYEDDFGNAGTVVSSERYYMPSEITWLLSTVGFSSVEIFGAKLGAFCRSDRLTKDDFEMLVVAVK